MVCLFKLAPAFLFELLCKTIVVSSDGRLHFRRDVLATKDRAMNSIFDLGGSHVGGRNAMQ